MKKVIIFLMLSVFFGCKKQEQSTILIDVPDWLRTELNMLDQQIKADPNTSVAHSAWLRYTWKSNFYYETTAPNLNIIITPLDENGNSISDFEFEQYCKEKCCVVFVWKGPKY